MTSKKTVFALIALFTLALFYGIPKIKKDPTPELKITNSSASQPRAETASAIDKMDQNQRQEAMRSCVDFCVRSTDHSNSFRNCEAERNKTNGSNQIFQSCMAKHGKTYSDCVQKWCDRYQQF